MLSTPEIDVHNLGVLVTAEFSIRVLKLITVATLLPAIDIAR
jgi:hypothetical protein